MQEVAKARQGFLICADLREEISTGVYYNTAAVIDADGVIWEISQEPYPACQSGLLGKVLLPPGNLGYPAFDTAFARIGVYICYDRHFPEGARLFGSKRRGNSI